MCAPARRSSTRRPTACFRSRRTKTCADRRAVSDVRGRLRARRHAGWASAGSSPGRSSARPGSFARTTNRRDFALEPFEPTLLDGLKAAGLPVVGIGKIEDLFAGRGLTKATHTKSDDDGMTRDRRGAGGTQHGLIFANLVDFDTRLRPSQRRRRLRRQPRGVRHRTWPSLLRKLQRDDLLIVTADHGNDPTTPSTDHSREYVPLLISARP